MFRKRQSHGNPREILSNCYYRTIVLTAGARANRSTNHEYNIIYLRTGIVFNQVSRPVSISVAGLKGGGRGNGWSERVVFVSPQTGI